MTTPVNDVTDYSFDRYQCDMAQYAVYPDAVKPIYPILGLIGEFGEFCQKLRQAMTGVPGFADAGEIIHSVHNLLLAAEVDLLPAERLKKQLRDNVNFVVDAKTEEFCKKFLTKLKTDDATRDGLVKEAGDGFWYNADFFRVIGVWMSYIARCNKFKLESRKQRSVLKGDGDNR